MTSYRIVFAGTPEFAADALKALIGSNHEVVAVYTQPDRPAGRGQKLVESPVKQLAMQYEIPVEQPLSFKASEELNNLQSYKADLMVVAAYGIILPLKVLESPNLACLNIHASILPRWRGAAPIQRAIAAGDNQTGITVMLMNEGLDTGDMLLKRYLPIQESDTGSSLHDNLAILGARAILECLDDLPTYLAQRCPQDKQLANYANKLTKEEARINWFDEGETIQNTIRAFNSWPVSYTELDSQKIRIWAADFKPQLHQFKNGEICSHEQSNIGVACTGGILFIQTLQLPGKKSLACAQVLNGKKEFFAIGKCFES